jgi:hypothetical protein
LNTVARPAERCAPSDTILALIDANSILVGWREAGYPRAQTENSHAGRQGRFLMLEEA